MTEGEDVHEAVRYLLEHVIGRYGGGCFAAAYCQANWESIGVARPLRDRGFKMSPVNRQVWVAPLSTKRPSLSDDPDNHDPDDD